MKPKMPWFLVAVGLQLLLLGFMIVPRMMILTGGKTVLLETEPYDPYNIFTGYYANLNYKISQAEHLPVKPHLKPRGIYYVVVSIDKNGIGRPRRVMEALPRVLKEDEAVIRGRHEYGWMKYGIESYYLPESRRHEIEALLRDGKRRALVEVKVNDAGKAVIVSLHVAGRRFSY